jgi:hypothetical protein
VGNSVGGIIYLNHITWALIEDCKISFFSENIGVDASLLFATYGFDTNVTIRRNVIVDAYTINTNGGNGIHFVGVNNVVIEENIIDHNGYQANLTIAGQYMFNHNIYVSAYVVEYDTATISNPIVLRRNIVANDASGSQLRSGGTITNNLWVRNPYPYSIGFPTAFQSVISNDVYLEAASSPGQNLNWGPASGAFSTNYNKGTVSWQNNIIAHSSRDSTTNYFGINLDTGYVGAITGNILYDWQAPLLVYPSGTTVSGNLEDANGANSAGFPDPTRTVGSYAGTIGLSATTTAFLAAARMQSRDNWDPRLMADAVNAYIRAGFGKPARGP